MNSTFAEKNSIIPSPFHPPLYPLPSREGNGNIGSVPPGGFSRLRREERGQVLYMTLVAMLFLTVFSLVLVNVIYLSIMKIKAQNAADNIALSAATLRARVFNKMTDLNAVIETVGLQMGSIHYTPFASLADACFYGSVINICLDLGATEIAKFNQNFDPYLSAIARGNGLDDVKTQVKVFPAQMMPWQVDWKIELLKYWQDLYYPPGNRVTLVVGWIFPPCTAMTPNANYLFVQSRVVWPLRDRIIGFKSLGVLLPDLVACGQAQITPSALPVLLPPQCSTFYSVSLVQPYDQYREKIKNQDWIQ